MNVEANHSRRGARAKRNYRNLFRSRGSLVKKSRSSEWPCRVCRHPDAERGPYVSVRYQAGTIEIKTYGKEKEAKAPAAKSQKDEAQQSS
jgi:hypothetical protein